MSKSYLQTKRFWTEQWWQTNPDYGQRLSHPGYIQHTARMIKMWAPTLAGSKSFCELGLGNGRNIYYFHERFPNWRYRGNDIYPDIRNVIFQEYPDVLEYADITIADTLEYLKTIDCVDIFFTHGHLMHLPNDVIEEVCKLMAKKATRFIMTREAHSHVRGAEIKHTMRPYRFERDYMNMFPGFAVIDLQIENSLKTGHRQAVCLFAKDEYA